MNILLEIQETPWALFGIGFSLVFIVLAFLVLVFNLTPKVIGSIRSLMNPPKKEIQLNSKVGDDNVVKGHITAGESAAIATALHFYFNQNHDEESNVITIKRIERRYTPWSSKIYGMRGWK